MKVPDARRHPSTDEDDPPNLAADVFHDGGGEHLGLAVDVAAHDCRRADLRDGVAEPRHHRRQEGQPGLDPEPQDELGAARAEGAELLGQLGGQRARRPS